MLNYAQVPDPQKVCDNKFYLEVLGKFVTQKKLTQYTKANPKQKQKQTNKQKNVL